jgi:hypothetical protein
MLINSSACPIVSARTEGDYAFAETRHSHRYARNLVGVLASMFLSKVTRIARTKVVDRDAGMTLAPTLAVAPEKIAVCLRKMVNVTEIEPLTPCLQSIGFDSIRSIHYCHLLAFPTIRGTCLSLNANLNGMKTLDSCTVRTQP